MGSGISNSIKNNTIFRILHLTESDEGIHSVIDKEPLKERGINPKEFQKGEVIIKNENNYYNVRSLFVPDDFINDIHINSSKVDTSFKKEMDTLIVQIIESYSFENKIYDMNECLNDFGLLDT